MNAEQRRERFRALGATLEGRDFDAYTNAKRDPDEPIIGEGDRDAKIAFFGRDPGANEVVHGEPFVGAGGQKVRAGLHRALVGGELPDFAASLEAGRVAYWVNTVPYKPLGNKAWSTKIIKAFHPLIGDLIVNSWRGTEVIPLGEGAFTWFGLLGPKSLKDALAAHWARDDRFETSLAIEFATVDPIDGKSRSRALNLHPLPHPSPLNATWTPHFPRLLDARLAALGLRRETWKREGA